MKKSTFISYSILLLITVFLFVVFDLFVGSVNLFSLDSDSELFKTILYSIRLPKALTCVLSGSALALCGLLMQSLFRNPLAGPYVLGVSSGSSLFVAIATMVLSSINVSGLYFFGKSLITLFSMAGAFLVTIIILLISKKNKSNITILLLGMMLSQIFGALQGVIEFMSSSNSLKTFVMWGMGSVSTTTLSDLSFVFPIYLIGIFSSFLIVKPLNAILLNDYYASNLGINVSTLRLKVIIITALLVGLITAFCGPIAFVGISVPIASRLIFKTSHHLHQIVFCLLLGACVVVFADLICQLLSSQFILPINTITTLIGSPVVIYLLFKSKLHIV
ncbi:MAG: FecCD family ABC transporter permease [Bacteroidota bacterium]